jgi:hypothetical protein
VSPIARRAAAAAALVAGLCAASAYVAVRLWERLRTGPLDPALVVSEAHVGFYWRAAVAGWAGLAGAAVAFVWLRGRASEAVDLAAARAGRAAPLVALGCALLVWLFP